MVHLTVIQRERCKITTGTQTKLLALLTFALVGGFIQDGLGRHNFAISVRTQNKRKTGSTAASRLAGIHSVHVSLPTCPQAAYRCTHEYLLSVSGGSEGSLSAPTLSGGAHKRVPLRSPQQTALLGQNLSAPDPLLRYSGILLLSSVLTASRRPKLFKRNKSGL